MKIEHYKDLIINLPVREQAFTTKRTTWKTFENDHSWFKDLNGALFHGANKETLTISRQDIFDFQDSLREFILKTFYWGYTSGTRGNNFKNFLDANGIDRVELILSELQANAYVTATDFRRSFSKIKEINGIGLSTFSKLLYFLGVKIDGISCLILDLRLINVFTNNIFSDFQNLSKIKYDDGDDYLKYLSLMNEMSLSHNIKGENIEQFLYMFGNNLKPVS